MKNTTTKSLTLVAVILIIMVALSMPAYAAKPKPVKGLLEMFENFNELEEEFRESNWEEAEEVVGKIEADYKGMVGELKETVDGTLIHKFGFLIGSFKKNLAKKDEEILEKPYMNLQSLFLDIMDYYDYPTPPVLTVVKLYIDESEEYVKKGMYNHVAGEIDEINELRERVEKSQGIDKKRVNEFYEIVEKIEDLAEKKDKEGLKSSVEKASGILKLMM